MPIAVTNRKTFNTGAVTHGHQLNASNTGVIGAGLAYGDLTPSGTVTSTSHGQVIEGLDVTGQVRIRHDNVTVRNCRVNAGRVENGTAYCIDFSLGTPTVGARIEWCEIEGAASSGVVHFDAYTAYRCNVHDCVDGFKAAGNTTIEECYIHDLWAYITSNNELTHNDCIQIRNGIDIDVLRCRVEGPWQAPTAGILAQAADNNIVNLTITDCVIGGGGYGLYLTIKSASGYTNSGTVTGNWFAGATTIKSFDDGGAFDPTNSWYNGMVTKSGGISYTTSDNWLAPILNHASPISPWVLDGNDLRAVTV